MDFNRRTFLKSTTAALGTSAIVSTTATANDDVDIQVAGREIPDRSDQVSTSRAAGGMVSTNKGVATQAGLDILEDGGNAFDAAAAATLALCVADPRSTGLGGGGNTILYSADEDITCTVNHHVRAAGAAEPELFRGEDGEPLSFDELVDRGLAFGVPGLVKGLNVLLDRWGTRDFAGVIDPAIELATEGIIVEPVELGYTLQEYGENFGEAARDVFFRNGEPYQVGERLVQDDLARSLRLIKDQGAEVFYEGEIADAIADTIQDQGGITTEEDFARYTTTVDSPLWYEYSGHSIASGPTSNGYTLAGMLELLDGFDLSEYGVQSADKYQLIVEAMRLAQADADEYVGDPEFVDVPWEGLLSEEYIDQRRELITLGEAITDLEAGDPQEFQSGSANQMSSHVFQASQTGAGDLQSVAGTRTVQSSETTYATVADSDGNIVGINQSLGIGFQGGLVVPDYGIMLSVIQSYFDTDPSSPSVIEPYKRDLWGSSTIVFQDDESRTPLMCLGSPGEMEAAVSSVILHVLEYEMTLAEAIVQSRVEGQGQTEPAISWEEGVPADAREELEQRGYDVPEDWADVGNVNAILVDDDEYVGAADPRRDGTALGVARDKT